MLVSSSLPQLSDGKSNSSAQASPPLPLRSVHTTTFPQLLEQLGLSLLVSTYQAGKLVVLRADNGSLNTHFRGFRKPMGVATDGHRLALGTSLEVWEFHNAPAVGRKLEPAGRHDACFLPRGCHVTGDIQVHEMAWASDGTPGGEAEAELWVVNTRFSCLCTLDRRHSFVPRWRPPFITALAPEDRCHLNGLALVPGARGGLTPRYVTAHGHSDAAAGWRQDKAHGGILLDVQANEVVVSGLSMPHSPRWYGGRLWMLESGAGTLGVVDLAAGRYEPIAQLPGFTRGLDFYGPYAFVGLSQVRESAVFSGIAIAERALAERACGVWVLDIRSGQTVAFVKFEDAVQEIFAVGVLAGIRFPDVIEATDASQALLADSFILPDQALQAVPSGLRTLAYD